jgi:hypothetical protein
MMAKSWKLELEAEVAVACCGCRDGCALGLLGCLLVRGATDNSATDKGDKETKFFIRLVAANRKNAPKRKKYFF